MRSGPIPSYLRPDVQFTNANMPWPPISGREVFADCSGESCALHASPLNPTTDVAMFKHTTFYSPDANSNTHTHTHTHTHPKQAPLPTPHLQRLQTPPPTLQCARQTTQTHQHEPHPANTAQPSSPFQRGHQRPQASPPTASAAQVHERTCVDSRDACSTCAEQPRVAGQQSRGLPTHSRARNRKAIMPC